MGAALCRHSCPFGVGIGVGGDPAADPQHGVADGVELDGSDRDIELAPGDGDAKPTVPQYIPRRCCSHCEISWRAR